MIDARAHLQSLIGKTVHTLTHGRPNRILAIRGNDVIVAANRSPGGEPVPIEWVQNGIDELVANGEVVVDVPHLGHRSSFVGAVLATLPDSTVTSTTPRRVRLRSK